MTPIQTKQGSALGKIIGHPLRIRCLVRLTERKASPSELAKEFETDLGTVYYHVKELEVDGVIEEVETRSVKNTTEHFYRAVERPQIDDAESEALGPEKRAEWIKHILSLCFADIASSVEAGTFSERPDHNVCRYPAIVDQRGWEDLTKVYGEALRKAMDIEAESAGRLIKGKEEGIPTRVLSFVFEMPS